MLSKFILILTAATLTLTATFSPTATALEARDFAIELTAQVQSAPPQIRLQWAPGDFEAGYTVSRKRINDGSWVRLATLPASAAGFVDPNVVPGGAYEYEIAQAISENLSAYGYIYAGIEVPFPATRGRIILVVDQTHASALAAELGRLASDLVGDGWTVLRHEISRGATPGQVRAAIRNHYNADPQNTKAVLLFGRVPVPYSGTINPDFHPGHLGAWPADAFYGDMEGNWTDFLVNTTGAEDPRNDNVPGDGKFDPSEIPGRVALQVGRVDMSQLPAFAPRTELDLLRDYLHKNHQYRHKLFQVERRGLIRDNFGEIEGDAPATDAWRSFTPFFGAQNVHVAGPNEFFPILEGESYLWAYGGGGGGYYHADTIGSTVDFVQQSPRCVFFMLHGSYFGDWDTTDNFLRASLASRGYGLAAAWTGLPHWFFHPMALGEPIGYSALLAQNNRTLYKNHLNFGAGQVHIALMGDPTLRMHVVAPPSQLRAIASKNGEVILTWNPSPEPVHGYYLYRAESASGPFPARLTRFYLPGTSYIDPAPPAGPSTYMVRAVKLESSPSGTYFNPSQGIFASPQPGNLPPTISAISDQVLVENTASDPLTFVINDPETAADHLILSASSSNSELVPPGNLALSGNGSHRALVITPAPGQIGAATITVSVGDGVSTAQTSFQLLVLRLGRTVSILCESNGPVVVQFEGTSGHAYAVERSNDLLRWTSVGTGLFGTNTMTRFIDPRSANDLSSFYRVRWP